MDGCFVPIVWEKGGTVMQENRFGLHSGFLIVGFLLLIGLAYGVLLGCSASSNREKGSAESGGESSNPANPPKIGETVTTERAFCLSFSWSFARVEPCKIGFGIRLEK